MCRGARAACAIHSARCSTPDPGSKAGAAFKGGYRLEPDPAITAGSLHKGGSRHQRAAPALKLIGHAGRARGRPNWARTPGENRTESGGPDTLIPAAATSSSSSMVTSALYRGHASWVLGT